MKNSIKCINFHRPEWTHRKLSLYYVKFRDGSVKKIWAYDACDVIDSVDKDLVIEYGTWWIGIGE